MKRDPRVSPAPAELVGVLGREVPVRVVNASISGLLLESAAYVEVGSACELRIHVDDETYVDNIRVTRCLDFQGSGFAYRVGAQFLWTTGAGPQTVRRLAMKFRTGQVQDPEG